ncbi:MAG: hypothetical protein WA584_01330 [Pyrinomonadaceae bacterium]
MERWFRIVLFATAALNLGGSIAFVPSFRSLREMSGFPEAHPAYLWILAAWIFAFGVCYLWMAITESRERLFIAIGAIGKLSFFVILAIYSLTGGLPANAALGGAGDLIFGCLFVYWLAQNKKAS